MMMEYLVKKLESRLTKHYTGYLYFFNQVVSSYNKGELKRVDALRILQHLDLLLDQVREIEFILTLNIETGIKLPTLKH